MPEAVCKRQDGGDLVVEVDEIEDSGEEGGKKKKEGEKGRRRINSTEGKKRAIYTFPRPSWPGGHRLLHDQGG